VYLVVTDNLIYSVGTQVVVTKKTYLARGSVAHPAGAVAVIVRSPLDRTHPYRVKFNDGFEVAVHHDHLVRLSEFKRESVGTDQHTTVVPELRDRIIYRCVIGSRAYGLDDDHSDTDRRGIYLPTAEMHWSLYGVPEQLEDDAAQEAYWELQKFIVLALKANPNVLECLYSPLVEHATPLALELLEMRDAFLSKLVFQTYSGYVASQFKKMQTDIRNQGRVKWKHVMHLIRLLMAGIDCLRSGTLTIEVAAQQRDHLLAIKRGEVTFGEADAWRKQLQIEFEATFQQTRLPDRPDYARANSLLIAARRLALQKELP
jgi:uncharacterized protein